MMSRMIRNDDNDDDDDDDDANDVDDGVQDDDDDDDDDDDVVGVPEVSMPVVDRARCPSRLQSISEGGNIRGEEKMSTEVAV